MSSLIAFLFCLSSLYLINRLIRPRDSVDIQMGVLGVFAIGYYALPIMFKQRTPLGNLAESDVVVAGLIHLFFILSVILGFEFMRIFYRPKQGFLTTQADRLIARRQIAIALGAFGIYLWYFFTQDLTSYSAGNFELFFRERDPLAAIIAALANICLACICLFCAMSLKARGWAFWIYAAMLSAILVLSLTLGQRLAFLTPLIMVLGCLGTTGQAKRSGGFLIFCVGALLLVSPLAVFVRESLADKRFSSASSAVGGFQYGDNAVDKLFQSILDRGDIIYVTARIKPLVDAEELPGPVYYTSVLANPIPKAIFPGTKPYLLSSNGEPSGELSILSWRELNGGTGSLTAFGGIVAYREARWFGVILNGFATGALFVLLGRWLAAGGLVAGIFYAQFFVVASVKRVPPSFFETLAELASLLPFVALFVLWNWSISNNHPRTPYRA